MSYNIIYIPIVINDFHLHALIDSGSSLNMIVDDFIDITEDLLEKIIRDIHDQKTTLKKRIQKVKHFYWKL